MLKTVSVFIFCLSVALATSAMADVDYDATDTRNASAPFSDLWTVTPSDVTVYDPPIRGCLVTDGGALSVNMVKGGATDGSSDAVIYVSSGTLVPIMADQILLTSTTASVVCGN